MYVRGFPQSLTFLLHALSYAALQPAGLAAVAVVLVDDTVSRPPARVHQVLPDAPLEEAFAALTTHCTIVPPCRQEEKEEDGGGEGEGEGEEDKNNTVSKCQAQLCFEMKTCHGTL